MPKMKTHSGLKQRFKVTGSGKLMRRQQNRGHMFVKKRPKRKRRLMKLVRLSREDSLIVRRTLGISANTQPD